jgi:hypothetical protein
MERVMKTPYSSLFHFQKYVLNLADTLYRRFHINYPWILSMDAMIVEWRIWICEAYFGQFFLKRISLIPSIFQNCHLNNLKLYMCQELWKKMPCSMQCNISIFDKFSLQWNLWVGVVCDLYRCLVWFVNQESGERREIAKSVSGR